MLNRKRNEHVPANHETSLIARGTVITGDVHFTGTLHLDGRIDGTISGDGEKALFTLSEHGQVHGEVHVPHAMINGHVQGDIHVSDRLELANQARVIGDVRYRTLEMAAGAQVNGRMSHVAETQVQRELPAPEARHAQEVDGVPA